MIDTVKLYCEISEELFNVIDNLSDTIAKYNFEKDIVYYKLSSGQVEGSYSSTLHFRVSENKHGIGYWLDLEGSYHKLTLGYNSHNGFYDIKAVCQGIIDLFSNAYKLKLPSLQNWYVNRIDISFVYDLLNQDNVCNYINNCRYLVYPRRRTQYFLNECVYFAGNRSTLKIYNKYLEFKKHDYKKMCKFGDFDIDSYCESIKGYVRFECELRKRKIFDILGVDKNKVIDIDMNVLNEYVIGDFMKLFKVNDSNICIVRSQNDVKNLLFKKYKECKARRLFGFYLTCVNDGINNVKEQYSSSSFYRNICELKDSGIDFAQQCFIIEQSTEDAVDKIIDFMPFVANCKFKEIV